jgi:hypothetical protein
VPIFDVHSYLGGSVIPGAAANGAAVAATMQSRGIDQALVFSAHARYVDPLAGNRILKATMDQNPSLFGCLVTHVSRMEPSLAVMKEMMTSRRFLGMAIASTDPNAPIPKIVADDLVNAYRRYSKPLFFFANNGAMVGPALELAKAYSSLKVVLIGMGGADWRTGIAAAQETTNLILETSGALDRAKIHAAVEAIGAHRIVFGSGTPHVDAAAALGLLEDSELREDARRRILYDNAARLFGLDEA